MKRLSIFLALIFFSVSLAGSAGAATSQGESTSASSKTNVHQKVHQPDPLKKLTGDCADNVGKACKAYCKKAGCTDKAFRLKVDAHNQPNPKGKEQTKEECLESCDTWRCEGHKATTPDVFNDIVKCVEVKQAHDHNTLSPDDKAHLDKKGRYISKFEEQHKAHAKATATKDKADTASKDNKKTSSASAKGTPAKPSKPEHKAGGTGSK